jgi:hypothetical protein
LSAVTSAIVLSPAPAGSVLRSGEIYWLAVAPASLDADVPAGNYVRLWINSDGRLVQSSRT